MKKLPIGINTFSEIISDGYLYIDKTKDIHQIITSGKAYFLSRPRRFGKSLLISTLGEIFLGNKELFKGLWIYNSDYNWKKYPVIRLDFSKQKAQTPGELKTYLMEQLDHIASPLGIKLQSSSYYGRFEDLILGLKNSGKVVVLIDEYDKPLIDHLTDIPLAKQMREILKGFFSVLKGNDEHLKFVFLTGVSKFSKAGIFSEMNHLNDITMSSEYSSLLGITNAELLDNFNDYIPVLSKEENLSPDALFEKIKLWYNGYCFSTKCTQVYNPFSTLLLFKHKEFKNFWFETGTPSFLSNLIKEKQYEFFKIPVKTEESAFSTYELDNLAVTPLLFQTGYLTIKELEPQRRLFTLDFPNYEVKSSFLEYLLKNFSNKEIATSDVFSLIDALQDNDLEKVFQTLRAFFSNIPYDIQLNYEKYYQTIFYCIFKLMGLEIEVECHTNLGSSDAVIISQSVYVFEFKFGGTKEDALQQIKKKKYYEPYLNGAKDIYLVGAVFEDRNIGVWGVEGVKG